MGIASADALRGAARTLLFRLPLLLPLLFGFYAGDDDSRAVAFVVFCLGRPVFTLD